MKIDLPDIRQDYGYDCGAACAVAVCRLFGKEMGLAECRRLLRTHREHGTTVVRLERFFREQKLNVLSGEMDMDSLRHLTRRGRPVVCLVRRHYVVALSARRGSVTFHDPEKGRRVMEEDAFLKWWTWKAWDWKRDRYGIAVW